MKADFNVHEGTFLLYPLRTDVWRKGAKPIAQTIVSLAKILSRHERVVLGVDSSVRLDPIDGVDIATMDYNDIWIRDSGVVPVGNHFVKFQFNAWGGQEGLYSDWSLDATVPEQMGKIVGKTIKEYPLIIEGGNILTNGNGTLICIERTVVNPNRNPNLSKLEAEAILKEALNVKKVIFIERGLNYDETGGHIDNLVAFANENTILLAWTDNANHPQYEVVRSAYKTLQNEVGANGEKFKIVKVPLPSPFIRTEDDCVGLEMLLGSKERFEGEQIQPSYINFIFANGAVIVPSFDCDLDDEVVKIFTAEFNDREIIQFPSREIVLGGGGLHCITKNY
ncbi:MAG: agmatine deiminase family protein [Clostridia bacterium]|nr:agmatine deiminase family protein [Clostridia bacterium]